MTNSYLSKNSKKHWKKSLKLIPDGVQTLSKMPSKYVEGIYPIYLEQGKGCYVSDREGNLFIDYPLGLGAILLGHNYPAVTNAVMERLKQGNIFTLPSYQETILAEKLHSLVSCCEMVRFLKTGSEATSAAIKIARSYTKREGIAFCGYHGWHDWFTVSTPKNSGIPLCYKDLIHKFEFNNIDSLIDIFTRQQERIAAVIIEPCIFEEPKNNFLKKVAEITRKNGALLIFDEVVTGFRFPKYSVQRYLNVTPDLATFGKAMGNGIPISCVCGKTKYMKELEKDCFVSSTFGGDLIGITAVLETIKVLENNNVIDHIWFLGEYLKDGYNEIAKNLGIDTQCIGYPNRTFHKFPTAVHKTLFWQECIRRGVFFGYAQFICYSHTQKDIDYTLEVIRDSLKILKDNWSNPEKVLGGKVAEEVFRLIVTKQGN